MDSLHQSSCCQPVMEMTMKVDRSATACILSVTSNTAPLHFSLLKSELEQKNTVSLRHISIDCSDSIFRIVSQARNTFKASILTQYYIHFFRGQSDSTPYVN